MLVAEKLLASKERCVMEALVSNSDSLDSSVLNIEVIEGKFLDGPVELQAVY